LFEQGEIKKTGRAFDIGIGGEGWILLEEKNNSLAYTRYGSFGMDKDGGLVHLPWVLSVITIGDKGENEKINLS
jgi:flagellar basal body rod protein FlgG